MSAEIINTADGIVTSKIMGKLAQPDLAGLQKAVAAIIKEREPAWPKRKAEDRSWGL